MRRRWSFTKLAGNIVFLRMPGDIKTCLLVTVVLAYSGARQPHIVLIVADDFGYNDIGYHSPDIRTPHLDKLSASGVRLESYYVQPICSPSRSQLLSGRYQIHTGLQHGVISSDVPNGLPLTMPTLADSLKKSGYSTHMVGKWHIGFYKKEYTPTYRGFDSFYGYLIGAEDYYTHRRCEGGMCGYDIHDNELIDRNASGTYSAHLFAEKAKNIIADHDPQKPLFLYLPFQSVHDPLEVPDKYMEPYKHIKNIRRRIYAGMVSAMDEAVGNVTEQLQRYGLMNNSLIIFTTDNGGEVFAGGNNWPLRGNKHTLWEGGVHGVGWVWSRSLEQPGSVSRELIHISDWYPTLLHLAGGSTSGLQLDGYNVWDTISKGSRSPRKELLHNIDPLYELVGQNTFPHLFDVRVRSAIRQGDWKLITGDPGVSAWYPLPGGESDLNFVPYLSTAGYGRAGYDRAGYDLAQAYNSVASTQQQSGDVNAKNVWLFNITADPTEHHDLSDKYPQVIEGLLSRLREYNMSAVPCRFPDSDPNSNPDLHGGAWQPWM